MGWTKLLPFFCAATETARDVAKDLSKEPLGSLAPHALESLMLPPEKWPEETLVSTCTNYIRLMEVYVDDFCTIVQTSYVGTLRYVSRALLHAIHSVSPPVISGHSGSDPVSHNKLLEEEGEWDVHKEILGWVFDGARWCIKLPTKNLDAIIIKIKTIMRKLVIFFKRFEKLVGKL